MLENGWSNLLDIFGRYEIATLQQGVCLASLEHCHRSSGRCSQINGTGAAGLLNYLGYIAKQALVDDHLIYIAAQLQEFCLAQNGLNIGKLHQIAMLLMALQNLQFIIQRRIAHRYLHQETIELSLGQAIGSFLLHGVLGGKDGIEIAHLVGNAIDAHLSLFHHLEECRLRLGRCTVDFIYQNNVGEDGALMELKLLGLDIEDVDT